MITLSLISGCDTMVIDPVPIIEIHAGYNIQLTASANGQWDSDNPSVATVSQTGIVTAVSAGKATISTYSLTGERHIVCYLEVNPRRNILFYIATDDKNSSIDGDTPLKIQRIREGWEPDQGEMYIFTDRRGQGASLLQIKLIDGIYGVDTLEVFGVQNSADANVLKGIINKVVTDYPADRWGMIFFSHASGWLPEGMLNYPKSSAVDHSDMEQLSPKKDDILANPRSLVIDNGGNTKHEMEYYDFAAAIPEKQFDFIIFEACLMADVMSMYELRNKTDYVIVSSAEIVAPGFEDTYTVNIMSLYNTTQSVDKALIEFADTYSTNYNTSFTLSILKMSEMDALATATKTALNGKEISEESVSTTEIQSFDRPNFHIKSNPKRSRYFDLGHTIENLVSESEFKTFNRQLEKTVIWKASTDNFLLYIPGQDGFSITRHSGLTTYIEQAVYPELNQVFNESSWHKVILP